MHVEAILPDDILLMAIELETVTIADDHDLLVDAYLLHIIDRYGAIPAVAGLVLAMFARVPSAQSAQIWVEISSSLRGDLARLMFAIQPQMTVRALGANNLCELLRENANPSLHNQIASALGAEVVDESHLCLAVMLPAAKDQLAAALAERAGSGSGEMPDWMNLLSSGSHRRTIRSFAFGALMAGRSTKFTDIVGHFDANDWESLRSHVRRRATELNATSINLFLSQQSQTASASRETRNRIVSSDNCSHAARHADIESGANFLKLADAAAAEDLVQLFERSMHIAKVTWRREVHRALLRRAIVLDVYVPGLLNSLPRSEAAAEIVIVRLMQGETAVLQRRCWQRVDVGRRFALLQQFISMLKAGVIRPTTERLDEITKAVLAMPPTTRGIIANHLIIELGAHEAMSDTTLEMLASIDSAWRYETLIVLARAHALRGEPQRSQGIVEIANDVSAQKLRDDGLRRLCQVLNDPSIVPIEPAFLVSSSLATLAQEDLPEALRLCRERLAPSAYEMVVADVIARGRATDAFAGSIA